MPVVGNKKKVVTHLMPSPYPLRKLRGAKKITWHLRAENYAQHLRPSARFAVLRDPQTLEPVAQSL